MNTYSSDAFTFILNKNKIYCSVYLLQKLCLKEIIYIITRCRIHGGNVCVYCGNYTTFLIIKCNITKPEIPIFIEKSSLEIKFIKEFYRTKPIN